MKINRANLILMYTRSTILTIAWQWSWQQWGGWEWWQVVLGWQRQVRATAEAINMWGQVLFQVRNISAGGGNEGENYEEFLETQRKRKKKTFNFLAMFFADGNNFTGSDSMACTRTMPRCLSKKCNRNIYFHNNFPKN